MHVVLRDLSRSTEAIAALKPILNARDPRHSAHPIARPEVIVHQGQFEFAQLAAWRDHVSQVVHAIPGVAFVDLDQTINRIKIGMADLTAAAAAEKAITAAGVPLEATSIILHAPFRPGRHKTRGPSIMTGRTGMFTDDSITLNHRPTRGGLKISRVSGPGTQEACTLGFNAWADDGSAVFVTNSHCMNEMGGTRDTYLYQANTYNSLDYVGLEYRDPNWLDYTADPNCPQNPFPQYPKCRYSDAALVKYDDQSSNTVWIGRIAKTSYYGTGWGNAGSLIVDASAPVWTITDVGQFPAVGDVLHKVGERTGWTYGTVSEDCVDATEFDLGTYFWLYCQDIISGAYFNEGDSGSPVFWVPSSPPGTTNVSLYGVAWGFNTTYGETMFSAYSNIQYDLGVLTAF
jgi:hypothetical protein